MNVLFRYVRFAQRKHIFVDAPNVVLAHSCDLVGGQISARTQWSRTSTLFTQNLRNSKLCREARVLGKSFLYGKSSQPIKFQVAGNLRSERELKCSQEQRYLTNLQPPVPWICVEVHFRRVSSINTERAALTG